MVRIDNIICSYFKNYFLTTCSKSLFDLHVSGQKSFAFGNNGDLIEINPSDVKGSSEGNVSNDLNIKENSKIYRNLEDTDTNYDKISNNISIQEVNEILPKKLSFDHSTELCDTNINLQIQTCKEQLNKENTNLDKNINFEEDISFNQTTQNLSDIRRASDGSCDVKFGENLSIVWGRRHSDSFVQTIGNGNGESILSQRRKTLKRQTRVTDTDAISYCNSKASISDTIQSKEVNLHKKVEIGEHSTNIQVNSLQKIAENTALRTEDESCGAKCLNTFSEGTNDYIQCLDNSLVKEKRQQDNDKCYVEKNQSLEQTFVDEEESTTCCCSGTTKYWEKMDKIIQENKNLENMVAKNTREMAEIREMLSNVLSVRLEPGF